MERTKNETTEKSTSKLKNSEPIPPTQREMHPSLTERDLLNQEENEVNAIWDAKLSEIPTERFQNVRKAPP